MCVNDTSIKIIKERRIFISSGGILVVPPFERAQNSGGCGRERLLRASFDVIVVRFMNRHLVGYLILSLHHGLIETCTKRIEHSSSSRAEAEEMKVL